MFPSFDPIWQVVFRSSEVGFLVELWTFFITFS